LVSVEKGPIGIDVYNLISSLEITMFRLKEIKLVFRKLARIFSSFKIAKNVI